MDALDAYNQLISDATKTWGLTFSQAQVNAPVMTGGGMDMEMPVISLPAPPATTTSAPAPPVQPKGTPASLPTRPMPPTVFLPTFGPKPSLGGHVYQIPGGY